MNFRDDDSDNETELTDNNDQPKYTKINPDNLDEDTPIPGQEYALFSFLSPEGIMNCNVRAVKFRGAFPTLDKATEYCKKLESNDKYFKIFVGETGKWLDFDPPTDKVDREMSSNKTHQKILDAQREQRMKTINELAGKYKDTMSKRDSGKKERIQQSKLMGAADEIQSKKDAQNVQEKKHTRNNYEEIKKRMAMRLAKSKQNADQQSEPTDPVDQNIASIRELMSKPEDTSKQK